jgi:hypothetical protein
MGLPPQPPLERGALAPSPWKGEGWGGVKGLCSNSNNLCIHGRSGGGVFPPVGVASALAEPPLKGFGLRRWVRGIRSLCWLVGWENYSLPAIRL